MNRTIRRFILALSLIIIITIVGTLCGFLNIVDVFNQVSIQRENNEYGGTTTTKVTSEDKIVSWTKGYDEKWTIPIKDKHPYMLRETLDSNKKVIQYIYYYLTDTPYKDAIVYYKDVLKDKELNITNLEEFTVIETKLDNYLLHIKVEPKDGKTKIDVSIDRLQK